MFYRDNPSLERPGLVPVRPRLEQVGGEFLALYRAELFKTQFGQVAPAIEPDILESCPGVVSQEQFKGPPDVIRVNVADDSRLRKHAGLRVISEGDREYGNVSQRHLHGSTPGMDVQVGRTPARCSRPGGQAEQRCERLDRSSVYEDGRERLAGFGVSGQVMVITDKYPAWVAGPGMGVS